MRFIFFILTFLVTFGVISYLRKASDSAEPQISSSNRSKKETAGEDSSPSQQSVKSSSADTAVPPPASASEAVSPDQETAAPSRPAPKVEIVQATPVVVDVSKLPPAVSPPPDAPRKSHPLMPGPGPRPVDAPVPPVQR